MEERLMFIYVIIKGTAQSKGKFDHTSTILKTLYRKKYWTEKIQQENKLGVAKRLCIRQERIRNDKNRKRVGVAPIVEKMVDSQLRWFGHECSRLVNFAVQRINQIEGSSTTRGKERPRKTKEKTIKRDLEGNGLDIDKMTYDSIEHYVVVWFM